MKNLVLSIIFVVLLSLVSYAQNQNQVNAQQQSPCLLPPAEGSTPKIPMDVRVNLSGHASKNTESSALIRTFSENYILMLQCLVLENQQPDNPSYDPRLELFDPTNVEIISGVVTNGRRLRVDVNFGSPTKRGFEQPPLDKKNLTKTGVKIGTSIALDRLGKYLPNDVKRAIREEVKDRTEIPVPDVYYFTVTITAKFMDIVDGKEVRIRKSVEPRSYEYEVYQYRINEKNLLFWKSGGDISLIGYDQFREIKPTEYVVVDALRAIHRLRNIYNPVSQTYLPVEGKVTPLTDQDDVYGRSQVYGAALSLLDALRWDKIRSWK